MSSGSLWMRVSTSFYRRVTVMVRDLDGPLEGDAGPPARIEELNRSDLDQYLRLRPDTRRAVVENRLDRGDTSLVAWQGDRIVHAVWLTTGRAFVAYLRRDLLLPARELLTYDGYTAPEHRESGIARKRMLHMFREFHARGFRRCWSIVAVENHPARQALESARYRAAGAYRRILLGPWDRCWTVSSSEPGVPPIAPSARREA